MEHFAGLDVSVNETSVCIVDGTGRIVREVKVASEPDALLAVLKGDVYHFKRIGLEAGPLSQWLYSAFAEAGLPVICVETRLSFPKIISAHIGDVARPERGRRQWCPIVGLFDEKVHLSVMLGAYRIGGKNSPQVRLAKDHHLIQALATQGADQAFRDAVLPG